MIARATEYSDQLRIHAVNIRAIQDRQEQLGVICVIRIGRELEAVNRILVEGRKWCAWCATELQMTPRGARNYINVFRAFSRDDVKPVLRKFASMACYYLAAPSCPPAAFEEAVALAKSGERISESQANKIIASHMASEEQRSVVARRATRHHPSRVSRMIVAREFDIDQAFEGIREILQQIRDNHPREKLRPVAKLLHQLVSREIEGFKHVTGKHR